ncbi:MAG: DedA family protein [Thermodesulfobacteriota bacterium]
MTFSPTQLLAEYGYLAVFAGSILEGETILILAGFAAHQGYLSFPLAVAIGFLGGALGDQTFFFLGRMYGRGLIDRFPRLKIHVERVNGLIDRFHSLVIIMVRFMYGLRVAGPVVIGTSGIPAWRFMVFNLLGAALWSFLVCGAGYVFGHALELVFDNIKRYEEAAIIVVIAVAVAWSLARHLVRGKKARTR